MFSEEHISTIYDCDGYNVTVELCEDRIRITVRDANARFHPRPELVTHYPRSLIEQVLNVKGPVWFTDEIAREEQPAPMSRSDSAILSYLLPEQLENARILDFGCGAGASTVAMARRFPKATFVGIDILAKLLKLAAARAAFYNLDNVTFIHSKEGETLPTGVGQFDCIVLNAVYEHLLPNERRTVLPNLWASLCKGGVMIICETPNRWFPIETHTTGGLPFINYMPGSLAAAFARRSPYRDLKGQDWPTLLRNGLRGGSISELKRYIPSAVFLDPREGDRIDLWISRTSSTGGKAVARRGFAQIARGLKRLCGIELVPYLTLALKKPLTR